MLRHIFLFPFTLTALFLLSSCAHNTPQLSTSISGIINHYASVIETDQCSGITVDNSSKFSTGDLVMIIQMQGALIDGSNTPTYGTVNDYGSAGLYEIGRIKWISGNTIHLQKKLINTYEVSGNVQIVYIPEYKNVTIDGPLTCQKWNGKVGGILAIQASGAVILNADFNVDGKGFRGGEVHDQTVASASYESAFVGTDSQKYSKKGEGIAGFGEDEKTLGRGAPANGGGGGGNHNAGGGGGANGGCGGIGGYSYKHSRYSGDHQSAQGIGGYAHTQSKNRLFFGGGGGAGHSNQGSSSNGGNGGGIIFIQTTQLIGNSYTLYSRGVGTLASVRDGASGAGAGGTVVLDIQGACEQVSVDVSGGTGGNTNNYSERQHVGTGGGGGGGVIWVTSTSLPGTINPNFQGGQNGISLGSSAYGATSGCNGAMLFGLLVPKGTTPCDENEEVRTENSKDPNLALLNNISSQKTL